MLLNFCPKAFLPFLTSWFLGISTRMISSRTNAFKHFINYKIAGEIIVQSTKEILVAIFLTRSKIVPGSDVIKMCFATRRNHKFLMSFQSRDATAVGRSITNHQPPTTTVLFHRLQFLRLWREGLHSSHVLFKEAAENASKD